jgi:hypothetical protein
VLRVAFLYHERDPLGQRRVIDMAKPAGSPREAARLALQDAVPHAHAARFQLASQA